jgi:NAD-specific glutamate dehydrogenase
MASDIVERLETRAVESDANDEMLFVAADEIAALRSRVAELEAALRDVRAWWDDPWTTGADGDPELKEEQLDAILARALDGAGND